MKIFKVLAWAFYDFANSAYAVLILSFIFPIYFKEVVAGVKYGDFYWGCMVSVSILLSSLLAPIVGAVADQDGHKKNKLIFFSLIAIVGTALLFFSDKNRLLLTILIFVITNTVFGIAQTLYNGFLYSVSTEKTVGRVSGFGWGLGYIGGLTALLLLKLLYEQGYVAQFAWHYKLVFPLTALFFLIFALPAFIFLIDSENNNNIKNNNKKLTSALYQLVQTIRDLKNKYKSILWFLIGCYCLNDVLVTLFTFMPLYARATLNMGFKEIMRLIFMIQVIAFPAATLLGWLSDCYSQKKILLLTIIIWIIIIITLIIAESKTLFYLLALLTGLVIGSSQAIVRSWFSQLIPAAKRFEFFGFNSFASKVSAVVGPALFGSVSVITHNQRWALLTLLPFLLIAGVIFCAINNK